MARDERRRDPGEFYPGGKVWVRPGQSQPQGRVTWEQIEGKPQIAPLPDRYRESDMKGKINEIASKFALAAAAALIGWAGCADVSVTTKRLDELWNDDRVVVDVTGGGVEESDPVATPRVAALETEVVAHTGDTTNNPHQVTAEQVGALPLSGGAMDYDAEIKLPVDPWRTADASPTLTLDDNLGVILRSKDESDQPYYGISGYSTDGTSLFTKYRCGDIHVYAPGPLWDSVLTFPLNRSGTFALTSDIPPPPGNYCAVSNAAMWASNEVVTAASTIASHTSQLSQQSQSIADNAAAISAETTRATAAETSLQAQIDLFKSFTAIVTNALPATGEDGCIYLVPIADSENKAEWLWVHEPSNHWEKIGTTAIDMSDYAKSAELATEAGTRSAADSAHDAAIANLTAAKMDKATSAASGYLAVFDDDGNAVKSSLNTMDGDDIDANGWIDAHSGFFINGNYFAHVGGNGVCLLSANEDEIYLPEIGGTFALLSDVTAVSNYVDSVLGPISTALDAILGGH